MNLKDAIKAAKKEAANGYVQHVNKNSAGNYDVSDWYDYENTVISFEGSRVFNDNLTKAEKISAGLNENENKLKKIIREEIKKIIESKRKRIKEEYTGERNFNSEKAAAENYLKNNIFRNAFNAGTLHLVYKQFTSPNDTDWKKYVPEWNTKKPSNEHNPTIKFSYKTVHPAYYKKYGIQAGGNKYVVIYWLDKTQYK